MTPEKREQFGRSRHKTLETLLPSSTDREPVTGDQVDPHMISVIILLATRADVLAKVFPPMAAPDPQPLLDLGVEPSAANVPVLQQLSTYHQAFSSMQEAWMTFSSYTDPPCLSDRRIKALVGSTIRLRDVPVA